MAAPWGNTPPQLQTTCSISTQLPKAGLLAYETVDDLCLCVSAIPTAEVSGNYEGVIAAGAQDKFGGETKTLVGYIRAQRWKKSARHIRSAVWWRADPTEPCKILF